MDVSKEKLVVVKHNDLIKSAYKLSLVESRIVLACIAQVNSKGTLSHLDKFSVSVEGLRDLLDTDSDADMYANLKSALVRLSERWVTFVEPSSRSGERNTRWVHSVDYIPQTGSVDLFFAPFIIPFLSEIKSNFTQYKLENVLNLRSSYGIRLYEILKSSMSSEVTLTVAWLRETLELPESYSRIDNLKARVLDVAVAEINQYTDMTTAYTQIKKGKKVVSFKFVFTMAQKVQRAKPVFKKKKAQEENEVGGVDMEEIKKAARPGETASQVAQRLAEQEVPVATAMEKIQLGLAKYLAQTKTTIEKVEVPPEPIQEPREIKQSKVDYYIDLRKQYGEEIDKSIPKEYIEHIKMLGLW